jgi:transcriptional regulator with XRE-family HTH domain
MRDFTSDLLARMGDQPRAALADAAGVSPAYITKVLKGSENFTIETMAKLALAVGGKVRIHIADLNAETSWVDTKTATPTGTATGARRVAC